MKITTHRQHSKPVKKVEAPKEVVKQEEEIPKYKVVLPKEEKKIEPLFSLEVEKLLAEDEEEIDE